MSKFFIVTFVDNENGPDVGMPLMDESECLELFESYEDALERLQANDFLSSFDSEIFARGEGSER